MEKIKTFFGDDEMTRGLVTVKSFARMVRKDPFTIYRQLWAGKLKGLRRKKDGRWVIPAHQASSQLANKGGEGDGLSNQTRPHKSSQRL